MRRSRFGLACFLLAVYAAPYACAAPLGRAFIPASYPVEGNSAVNAVRSRDGGSIPSRGTGEVAQLAEHSIPNRADAHSNRARPADLDALTRACVAEARWQRPIDCAVIWHVLARYADEHRVTIATATRRLVWDWSRPPAWVRQLRAGCWEPSGWPNSLRWEAHRPLCLALYDRASAFLAGRVADPCDGKARGWRSPGVALRRALDRGWVQVSCGAPTAVAFVGRAS